MLAVFISLIKFSELFLRCEISCEVWSFTTKTIGLLHDPVTWYGINYTGTQITQWGWTGTSSFVLEVPLCNLRPSVIYFVPCDWIVQRTYFCPSLHAFKINWIALFHFKSNSRKWENSFCVFQRNSPKYSNDQQGGKLDWNWLKFYGERNTGLRAVTAPNYKQPNKLSQLQNTQLNLLTVTFLAIVKWTEINLRWLIVDGCVKDGKRLIITVNC